MVLAVVDRQVMILVSGPLTAALKLSNSQLGLVQGLGFAIFGLLFSYPLASAADRFDRRLVLIGCILLWSLGTAGCGLATGFDTLFVANVAVAAGEAGLGPIILSAMPDLFSGQQRTTANLVYYVVSVLGGAAGLLLGGWAITALGAWQLLLPSWLAHLQTWRLAFFVVVVPAPLVVMAVAALRLRRREPATVNAADRPTLGPYLSRNRLTVLLVFGSIVLYVVAYAGVNAWIPLALNRIWGVSPGACGVGMGLAVGVGCGAGVLIAGVLMRRLVPRFGAKTPFHVGSWAALLGGLPTIACMLVVTAPWQVFVLVGVLMCAGTVFASLLPNVIQDMTPVILRARLFALFTIVVGTSAGLSTILIGVIADAFHGTPRGVLYAIACCGIPAWLLGVWLMAAAARPFQVTVEYVAAHLVRAEEPA